MRVLARESRVPTVGYVRYLKDVDEQTTAASIAEEQEESDEKERDEEERGATAGV